MNTSEAAAFLGFSTGHLRRLCGWGELPHYKVGGRLKFKKSELEHWLVSK